MKRVQSNADWERDLRERLQKSAVGWGDVAKFGIDHGLPEIAYAGAKDAATMARVLLNIRINGNS